MTSGAAIRKNLASLFQIVWGGLPRIRLSRSPAGNGQVARGPRKNPLDRGRLIFRAESSPD
jgi:hypothetical protein